MPEPQEVRWSGARVTLAHILRINEQKVRPHGHSESASTKSARDEARQKHGAGTRGQPAKTGRLHARLHDDAEKAELGYA